MVIEIVDVFPLKMVDFPIKNGGFFHSYVKVYQAGYVQRGFSVAVDPIPSHKFWIQLRLKRGEVVEKRHLKDQNHPNTWMVIYILVQMDGL